MRKYIAILAALRRETSGLREGLCHLRKVSPSFGSGSLWIGEDLDHPILLGHSGVGPSQATQFAENLIRQFPIEILLPIGFAGGLQPRLRVGEIILADRVRYHKLIFSDRGLFDLGETLLKKIGSPYSTGCLLSADRLAGSPEEKRDLALREGAVAIDMESGAVSEAAKRAGIPFLPIRVVSDSADDPLDPWLAETITPAGGIGYGRLIGGILERPERILTLSRLRKQTSLASMNLGRFLVRFLALLEARRPE